MPLWDFEHVAVQVHHSATAPIIRLSLTRLCRTHRGGAGPELVTVFALAVTLQVETRQKVTIRRHHLVAVEVDVSVSMGAILVVPWRVVLVAGSHPLRCHVRKLVTNRVASRATQAKAGEHLIVWRHDFVAVEVNCLFMLAIRVRWGAAVPSVAVKR